MRVGQESWRTIVSGFLSDEVSAGMRVKLSDTEKRNESKAIAIGRQRHVKPKRDPVMTTFYAIAGLLVVASHAHGALDVGTNLFPYYSYQIGMFAFASGWFYHEWHESRPWQWLWHRITRLIIPLLAINAAYGVIGNAVAPMVGVKYVPPICFDTLVRQPFLGGDMFVLDNPLWFVSPFFFATVIDFVIHSFLDLVTHATRKGRDGNGYASLVIDVSLTVIYAIAFVVVHPMPRFVDANVTSLHALCVRTLFMMPLVAFGRLVSHHMRRIVQATPSRSIWMLCVASLVQLVVVLTIGDTNFVAARVSFPHGSIAPLVTSVCGTMAWLGICQLVGPAVGNLRGTKLLARSTMSLMAHQVAAFFMLNCLYRWLSGFGGMPFFFDQRTFARDVWYVCYPVFDKSIDPQTIYGVCGIIYLIVGVLFSLLLAIVWDRIKKAVTRRRNRS
jgi:fucose 4-O-acetylase-like acetyltransferase